MPKIENFWTREDSFDDGLESSSLNSAQEVPLDTSSIPTKMNEGELIPSEQSVSNLAPKIKQRPLTETREIMMAAIASFDGAYFTKDELFHKAKISKTACIEAFNWFIEKRYLVRTGAGTKRCPFLYEFHPAGIHQRPITEKSERKVFIA